VPRACRLAHENTQGDSGALCRNSSLPSVLQRLLQSRLPPLPQQTREQAVNGMRKVEAKEMDPIGMTPRAHCTLSEQKADAQKEGTVLELNPWRP
jgi:hypothetical protein